MLLEIIQKRHPFENLSQQVIMNQIFTNGVLISDNIDEKIRKLLRNLLNRDYSKRWGYEEVNKWINDEEVIDYVDEDIEQYEKVKIEEWLREGFTEKTAREWMEIVNDPKVAITFKEEGFSVSEAKEWIEAGMKSGKLTYNWKNAGFNPKDAIFFEDNSLVLKKVLYFTKDLKIPIEDLKTYLEMKLDVNKIEEMINKKISLKEYIVFYNFGIKQLEEILEWKKLISNEVIKDLSEMMNIISKGFNSNAWISLGFTLEQAVKLFKNGINFNDAKKLKKKVIKNVVSVDEIIKFKKNGFSIQDTLEWILSGFNSYEAKLLRQQGITPVQAKMFKSKGYSANEIIKLNQDNQDMIIIKNAIIFVMKDIAKIIAVVILIIVINFYYQWTKAGFNIIEALEWKINNFSLQRAIELKKNGIDLNEAKKWKYNGFNISEAIEWKKNGFDLNNAKEWKSNEFNLSQALEWKYIGFDSEQAKEWKDAGFSVSEAIELMVIGFDVKKAKEWKDAGFDVSEAVEWRDKGFEPGEARRWEENEFNVSEAIKWKNAGFTLSQAIICKRNRISPEKAAKLFK